MGEITYQLPNFNGAKMDTYFSNTLLFLWLFIHAVI